MSELKTLPTVDEVFNYLQENGWIYIDNGSVQSKNKRMWRHPHAPVESRTILQAFSLQKKIEAGKAVAAVCKKCARPFFYYGPAKAGIYNCEACRFHSKKVGVEKGLYARVHITMPKKLEEKLKRVADTKGTSVKDFVETLISQELEKYE